MHMRHFIVLAILSLCASPVHAALARVPNLVGMSLTEAKAYLDQHAVSVSWSGSGDTIGAQKPKAGAKFPHDKVLQLTLKAGGATDKPKAPYDVAKTDAVPGVVGQTLVEARFRLQSAGFRVLPQPPTKVAPDAKSAGTVIEQEPAAGAKVPRPAAIKLTTYKPKIFRCPTFTGMTIREALVLLKPLPLKPEYWVRSTHGEQFRPEEVQSTDPREFAKLPVVGQDPEAGGDTVPGQSVRLQVRLDPMTVIPAVVGLPVKEAVKALSAAGVRTYVRGDDNGLVAALEPDPGQSVARRSLVYVQSDREPPEHIPGTLH